MSSRWGPVADSWTCLVVLQPHRLVGSVPHHLEQMPSAVPRNQPASSNNMKNPKRVHGMAAAPLTPSLHVVTQNRCAARTARCWR